MGVARYTAEPVGVLRSDNGAVRDAAPAAWLPTGETVDLHVVLYGLILGLPISGLLLTLTRSDTMELFGWMAPPVSDGGGSPMWGALHDWALPVLFTAVIATHLAAVLKHHFLARHIGDVRRMLR